MNSISRMNNHNLNLETCSFCQEMKSYENLMKSPVSSLSFPIDLAFQTRVHKHLREIHNIILDISPEIFQYDTADIGLILDS